jgi:hypothetical protein
LRTMHSGSWPNFFNSFTTARPVFPLAPTTAITASSSFLNLDRFENYMLQCIGRE